MAQEIKIHISAPQTVGLWARRLVSATAILIAPISIGIACDSAAMQWVGFVMSFILLAAVSKRAADDTTFSSIAEVRAYLDRIDAEARP